MRTIVGRDHDVAIVGGGPAGSVAATLLARSGRRVLVLERERFPRYHIGESLLSATLPVLAHIGVLPAIERAGFVRKPGGTFLWGTRRKPWSFWFREDPGGYDHAFHVLRSEFDAILLRHAESEGATIREGITVDAVEGASPVRLRGRDERGNPYVVEAGWAIDASGQAGLVGKSAGIREPSPFFRNLAVWSYFAGAGRLEGEAANNVFSAAHDEGWCWYIPLHDGTVSVGTVVDAARWHDRARGAGLERTYLALIDGCAPVRQLLRGSRQVAPVRAIRDYSYSSRRFFADGALLAGDAACFIDPVFSTGVHLACLAGLLAAEALGDVVDGRRGANETFESYDAAYRKIFERYRRFVTYFYNHHADPDSYFWQARKLVDPSGELGLREAFVRLVAGTGDLSRAAAEAESVDAGWRASLESERSRTAPGMHLMRVAATLAEMKRHTRS